MADWPDLERLKRSLGVTTDVDDGGLELVLEAAIEQVISDCGGVAITDPSASQSQAALVLAVMVAKAPDAPFGIAAVFDTGALRVAAEHPTYLKLLSGQRTDWPLA